MMDLSPSTNGIWEINAGSSCNLRLQLLGLAKNGFLFSRDAVHWVISLSDDTKVCH